MLCVSVYLYICVSVSVYVSVCSHVSVCSGSASVCLCGSEDLGLSFRTHSHVCLRKREVGEGRRERGREGGGRKREREPSTLCQEHYKPQFFSHGKVSGMY